MPVLLHLLLLLVFPSAPSRLVPTSHPSTAQVCTRPLSAAHRAGRHRHRVLAVTTPHFGTPCGLGRYQQHAHCCSTHWGWTALSSSPARRGGDSSSSDEAAAAREWWGQCRRRSRRDCAKCIGSRLRLARRMERHAVHLIRPLQCRSAVEAVSHDCAIDPLSARVRDPRSCVCGGQSPCALKA